MCLSLREHPGGGFEACDVSKWDWVEPGRGKRPRPRPRPIYSGASSASFPRPPTKAPSQSSSLVPAPPHRVIRSRPVPSVVVPTLASLGLKIRRQPSTLTSHSSVTNPVHRSPSPSPSLTSSIASEVEVAAALDIDSDVDLAYSSDTVVGPSPIHAKGSGKARSSTPARATHFRKQRFQKERSYSPGPWGPEF